jgi:hypothetical protein
MTTFPPTAMSLQLHPHPHDFKVHCADSRTNKHGQTVANCTLHLGHDHEHIDTHEGKRWAA